MLLRLFRISECMLSPPHLLFLYYIIFVLCSEKSVSSNSFFFTFFASTVSMMMVCSSVSWFYFACVTFAVSGIHLRNCNHSAVLIDTNRNGILSTFFQLHLINRSVLWSEYGVSFITLKRFISLYTLPIQWLAIVDSSCIYAAGPQNNTTTYSKPIQFNDTA